MFVFDGTQKEIGRGAQAIVYYYNGFAYKVYNEDYPKEWIQGELLIQNEINKTGLPVVKYYETEESNIIKMDFINGNTLAERMQKEKYKNGVEDIISMLKKVHTFTDINLPTLKSYAIYDIGQMHIDQEKKDRVLKFLDDIPDKKNLLHLDLHFLNIMYDNKQYYIIDWVNARIGNPVYDYARSYVIMNEFAYRQSRKFLSLITKDKSIDTTDLNKAIYVMAVLRTRENCNDRTLELINSLENEI